jgi:hypothetical protein
MPPLQERCLHRHVRRYYSNSAPKLKWDELNASVKMFYDTDSIPDGDSEDLYERRCRAAENSTMLWNAAVRPVFARPWIPIIKRARKAGAHPCTRQGVIGARSREKYPCPCGILPVDKIISTHDRRMARQLHFMPLDQTSSGREITAVQPRMSFPEYPTTQSSNGIVIMTSENGGIQKSTIKQYNADNTMLLHHSRRMERNVLLSWFTFQPQVESESVSRRFLIRLMITTKI